MAELHRLIAKLGAGRHREPRPLAILEPHLVDGLRALYARMSRQERRQLEREMRTGDWGAGLIVAAVHPAEP